MAKKKDGDEERGNWGGRLDFVLSTLSFAVGMGNLWRFPYLCYKSGGGAFLIPYVIFMVLCGYPLMLLEFAMGQYAAKGIVSVWTACPLFEGIGWGMFVVSIFTGIYYNMIVAWCFFYLFSSFNSDVPWRDCGNDWNTDFCLTSEDKHACSNGSMTSLNKTCGNQTSINEATNVTGIVAAVASPAEEFFNEYMLSVSEGLHDMGWPRWQLLLCLLLCWTIVFLALAKGIKVSGKVTYVTALLPYVVLTILLVQGLTLPGSKEGVIYYIKPDFSKLLNARIWGDAAIQAFFSLSLCWGGLVSMASYNKFHNNCVRDALVVATGDMLTSIYAGFVIFAIIGNMAYLLEIPIDKVATQGPGLAFIVYPEAVSKLPVSPLWSILFFVMLINIGIGSQMGLVSTIHTTMLDIFPAFFKIGHRTLLLLLGISTAGFLLGLSMTTEGGVYILVLLDTYSATYALLILAFAECIAIGWVFGVNNFYDMIQEMTGKRLSFMWMICWKFIDPVLILMILFFIFYDFKRTSYNDYTLPVICDVLGWGIVCLAGLMIPIVAGVKVYRSKEEGSISEKIQFLCKPSIEWGPGEVIEFTSCPEEGNIVVEEMNGIKDLMSPEEQKLNKRPKLELEEEQNLVTKTSEEDQSLTKV